MEVGIEKIYLSVEDPKHEVEAPYDNTDVIVYLTNGSKHIATFFSFDSLPRLRAKHKAEGLYKDGSYFWMEGMCLIDQCSKKGIEDIVQHLLEEGEFSFVFKSI